MILTTEINLSFFMENRRKHRRRRPTQPQAIKLHWRAEEDQFLDIDGELNDLSLGGCCAIAEQVPDPGSLLAIRIELGREGSIVFPALAMRGHVVATRPRAEGYQCSIQFLAGQEDKQPRLKAALFSQAYVDMGHDAQAIAERAYWGVEQWAAYLTGQAIPVLPYSRHLLRALSDEMAGQSLSPAEIAGIAVNDPLLVLMLLRRALRQKASRLAQEITTARGAVMRVGINTVKLAILHSPMANDNETGLMACSERSILAARLASAWGAQRHDINPEELMLAALLADLGELLLWHFAPEIPQAVQDMLQRRDFASREDAQLATCGFRFRDLTLRCALNWQLPEIVSQLIRGTDSARANIARFAVNIASLIRDQAAAARLASEIEQLHPFLPGIDRHALVATLNEVAGTAYRLPEPVHPA